MSILTFIPCTRKEKGLGPILYFRATIDFLFVEDRSSASVDIYICRIHLNHYIRPFRALP